MFLDDDCFPLNTSHIDWSRFLDPLQGYGVAGVSESGGAEEVENSPALSLTLALLPKVQSIPNKRCIPVKTRAEMSLTCSKFCSVMATL